MQFVGITYSLLVEVLAVVYLHIYTPNTSYNCLTLSNCNSTDITKAIKKKKVNK